METGNPITQRLYRESHGICVWCHKSIPFEIATIEHVIPIAKGGLRNDRRNLALACAPCNQVRGSSMGPPDPSRVQSQYGNVVSGLRKQREMEREPLGGRRAVRHQRQPQREAEPTRFCLGQMIPAEIWEKLIR